MPLYAFSLGNFTKYQLNDETYKIWLYYFNFCKSSTD